MRTLPSESVMDRGFHDRKSATPKNTTLKSVEANDEDQPVKGAIAVEKDTAPVRGNA